MNEQYRTINELNDLYLLEESDLQKAIICNADAYQGYELMESIFNGRYSQKELIKLWKSSIISLKKQGLIVAESNAVKGICVLVPQGFTGTTIPSFISSGGWRFPIPVLYRMQIYESYAMKLKKKHTNHESWYLYDLAVSKQNQGQGIATKILTKITEFLDNQKLSCYLETHHEANVKIYEKFGFTLVEVGKIPVLNIPHYAMLRKSK